MSPGWSVAMPTDANGHLTIDEKGRFGACGSIGAISLPPGEARTNQPLGLVRGKMPPTKIEARHKG